MEKIINQTHSKETFLYALSRTLERVPYYGKNQNAEVFRNNF